MHRQVFRTQGHRFASLDPLKLGRPLGPTTLVNNKSELWNVYCASIGWEFMHLPENEQEWIVNRLEGEQRFKEQVQDEKENVRRWKTIKKSEILDRWIGKKYPNVKRYSLEGAESLLLALPLASPTVSSSPNHTALVSMPHRGRLNVLLSLGFPVSTLLSKLSGHPFLPYTYPSKEERYTDDVLSHLFHRSERDAQGRRNILFPNPSQLEACAPVGQGFAYGLRQGTEGEGVTNITVHGDASFSGQGVVYETVNLAHLRGYSVDGSVRIIVNNQVGFTAEQREGRSSTYVTDMVKPNSLVAHVNGDNPAAVEYTMRVLSDFKLEFKRDVILDLYTYRRWGHNELDEPFYTNPRMYKAIRSTPTLASKLQDTLLSSSSLSERDIKEFEKIETEQLDDTLSSLKSNGPVPPTFTYLTEEWKTNSFPSLIKNPLIVSNEYTGVAKEELLNIAQQLSTFPNHFNVHSRLSKVLEKRKSSILAGEGIDFASAESLAFGSLIKEGYSVRVSGQDSARGTFSQRHAKLIDQTTGEAYVALNNLSCAPQEKKGNFEVFNSPLSEFAVLGFEQGVAWSSPKLLPIWEAQFGDFFTGAQITIDTYFASSESKWGLPSALTLLLPHGYDGAGAEHSSARIERFLQLSNEPMERDSRSWTPNVSLVNASNAAQYFHVLRRQMKQSCRRPLVIFTPKALLRHPAACSSLDDMEPVSLFNSVIDDTFTVKQAAGVEKVILVSGQWYYQLVTARDRHGLRDTVAIVRLEELTPFPYIHIESILRRYHNARHLIWAQEEPENSGAWTFVKPRLEQLLEEKTTLLYRGREALAVPAKSIGNRFEAEQKELSDWAFSTE